jgi:hypothetical protein
MQVQTGCALFLPAVVVRVESEQEDWGSWEMRGHVTWGEVVRVYPHCNIST